MGVVDSAVEIAKVMAASYGTVMFCSYQDEEVARKRLALCEEQFPDCVFTVGKCNGEWALALSRREN